MSGAYFRRGIGSALSGEGRSTPKTLGGLVGGRGLSGTTVLKRLKILREQGLVREEPLIMGRGRPRLLYHPTNTLIGSVNPLEEGLFETLLVDFQTLQRVCRHRKGGRCKETLNRCRASICPLRLKGTQI